MFERIGRYQVIRPIASGGMAKVYLAREEGVEGFSRTVVLKRILEDHRDNEEFLAMFLDEARLLGSLSHPNIAQVFNVGEQDGDYYLAMELVRGSTLRSLLDTAAQRQLPGLPLRELLGIAIAIAEALAHVHSRRDDSGEPLRIVHRDLNPSNVIVSYEGAVKLIDFGIAKGASRRHETRIGVVKGTYGYMAPEQLTGDAALDHRADVFALGVVLYEMCTLRHPFDGMDLIAMLTRMLQGEYVKPIALRPDLPPAIDRLIRRCLAGEPADRPKDMGVVIDEVASYLETARSVPTMRHIASFVRDFAPDAEGEEPVRPLGPTTFAAPLAAEELAEVRRLATSGPRSAVIVDDTPFSMPPPRGDVVDVITASRRRWGWAAAVALAAVFIGLPLYVFRPDLFGSAPAPQGPTIVVESDPPGASILVGGQDIGVHTPARVPISTNDPEVRVGVSDEGFGVLERTIPRHEGTLRFDLTAHTSDWQDH